MERQNPYLVGKHPTIRRDEKVRVVLLIVIWLVFGTIFLLSDRALITRSITRRRISLPR